MLVYPGLEATLRPCMPSAMGQLQHILEQARRCFQSVLSQTAPPSQSEMSDLCLTSRALQRALTPGIPQPVTSAGLHGPEGGDFHQVQPCDMEVRGHLEAHHRYEMLLLLEKFSVHPQVTNCIYLIRHTDNNIGMKEITDSTESITL